MRFEPIVALLFNRQFWRFCQQQLWEGGFGRVANTYSTNSARCKSTLKQPCWQSSVYLKYSPRQ